MLSPVPNSRRAFAAQASKLSGTGPRDDEIRLLRRAVLEYSSALKHEAVRFSCNVPDDPLWQRSSSFYLGPVIGRRMSRGAAYRRFFAGRSRPYWCRTRPDTAPLGSRTKVTCASPPLAKKSLLLSGQSCAGAPPMLDLIWSAPFCSVTSSSRPDATS